MRSGRKERSVEIRVCYSDSEKEDECSLLRTPASSWLHHVSVAIALCLDRVMLVNDSASKRIRRELDSQS